MYVNEYLRTWSDYYADMQVDDDEEVNGHNDDNDNDEDDFDDVDNDNGQHRPVCKLSFRRSLCGHDINDNMLSKTAIDPLFCER